MDEAIKVHLMKDEKIIETKDFEKPQNYNEFFENIIQGFNLKKKKSKVVLILVNEDDDEIAIKSQQDLVNNMDELREFKLVIVEDNIPERKISKSIAKNEDEDNSEENEKNNDIKNEEDKDDLKEGPNDIDDFDADEFRKEIESKLKIENIDINIEDDFIDVNYEQKLKEKTEKQYNDFKSKLENNINSKLNVKKQELQNGLNLQLSGLVNDCLSAHKNVYNSIGNLKDDFEKIHEQTNEMLLGLNDFKDIILSGQFPKLVQNKDPNQNQNNLSNVVPPNNMNNFHNPNPLNNIQDEIIEKIVFIKNKYNTKVDKKNAGFFTFDIEIKNAGQKAYKTLVVAKDDKRSSNDINFPENTDKKNICPNLTLDSDFIPDKIGKYPVTLGIQNPQPGQDYKIYLYIREKPDMKNLSEALEVNIHVNQVEDPNQNINEQINLIYQQFKDEYNNLEEIATEVEVKQQIKNQKLDMDKVKNWINIKKQEYEDQQKRIEAENIYNQLVPEMGIDMNKDELINIIINEHNNDIARVRSWMNNKRAEDVYNKLKNECDFTKQDKEDIKERIIELGFNDYRIKEEYKKQEIPVPQPVNNDQDNGPGNDGGEAANENDEAVNKLYEELDEEYGISGFKDEDEDKDKIRELNLNRDLIVKWIEESLLNN